MSTNKTPAVKEQTGNELVSTMPSIPERPTVSAAAALGLPENPHDTVMSTISRMRKDSKLNSTSSVFDETPKEEKPAKEEKSAKVEKTGRAEKTEKKSTAPKLVSEKPVGEEVSEEPKEVPTEPAPAKAAEVVAPVKSKSDDMLEKLAKDNEDLKKKLEDLTANVNKPQTPPTAPVAAKEEPKAQTPEELKKQEDDFLGKLATHLEAPLTEEEHNLILDGGPKAVAKLTEMRKKDMALSIYKARQSIYAEVNPVVDKIMAQLQHLAPVYDDYIRTQTARVEHAFKTSYPECSAPDILQAARSVSSALISKYPNEMAAMSEADTFKVVRDHTVSFFKQMGRDITAPVAPVTPPAAPIVAASPVVAAAPVVPVHTPVVETVKPAAAPVPRPPGATLPGALGQGGTTSKEKHKEIASSLTW